MTFIDLCAAIVEAFGKVELINFSSTLQLYNQANLSPTKLIPVQISRKTEPVMEGIELRSVDL